MKNGRIIFISVFIFFILGCVALAQEESLKDIPYFTGMPNYGITAADDKEFADVEFFDGKKLVRVEGKLWVREYVLKPDGKAASDLQIRRNYANAIKGMGGGILYDGKCQAEGCCDTMTTGKVTKGNKELWVYVKPCNEGVDYILTVLEKEAMKQDVTANDMLKALNEKGSVALYINFDVDKATIKAESKPIMDQIVSLLKGNPALKVSIEGHTDNTGTRQRNKTLSEQRAKAVADAIVREGVDRGRLSSVGWGQDKPMTDNGTEEGRAKNRRVELVKK
jgi:outer membrane protein OmpA-like peptidoglycan-associated protein